MPDPTATQQTAIEASIGSAQKIAMRIVDLPKDKREAGIEFVRRSYVDALEKFGIDNDQARVWLELQIKGIRSLISEIEASGGTGSRAKNVGTDLFFHCWPSFKGTWRLLPEPPD